MKSEFAPFLYQVRHDEELLVHCLRSRMGNSHRQLQLLANLQTELDLAARVNAGGLQFQP